MAHRFSLCILAFALSLLQGCAKPPDPSRHAWPLYGDINHVPMQGLAARPALVLSDAGPGPELLNFDGSGEELAEKLAARSAARPMAAAAAASMGAPICILFPPLCVGMIVAAGAAASAEIPDLSAEEARRLGKWFEQNAGMPVLASRLQEGFREDASSYPRVSLSGATIALLPAKGGVTFAIGVKARAITGPGTGWKETAHFVVLPTRASRDWLAGGGASLRSDFDRGARILGRHLRQTYFPYELREGQ